MVWGQLAVKHHVSALSLPPSLVERGGELGEKGKIPWVETRRVYYTTTKREETAVTAIQMK